MSISKKDPSLRVAANDPHLVSLGGGRLSTAVTIHNIPIGDCTIGSSSQCSISLSGAGVRSMHCTIYRSEDDKITLVPERNARILIDNHIITDEVDLRQGAMITLGESYYLRYNNPSEALQMRSAMVENSEYPIYVDYFYESNVNPISKFRQSDKTAFSYNNIDKSGTYIDFMGWQCPKVFTADLATVSMPAKDVLGQKYASFAKNLAENQYKDNSIINANCNINITPTLNNSLSLKNELINNENSKSPTFISNDLHNLRSKSNLKARDPLEDMLTLCAEYTDLQSRSPEGNGSITLSPVVQNRIKTNGSLPRDTKNPFYLHLESLYIGSDKSLGQSQKSAEYENVCAEDAEPIKFLGYENVKLVPQSPRTKIRTNCLSPKKEYNIDKSTLFTDFTSTEKSTKNYESLKKLFEEFQKEIDVIKKSPESAAHSKNSLSNNSSPMSAERSYKNINNLTIDINSFPSPYDSPKPVKKPIRVPREINKIKEVTTGSLSYLFPNQYSHEQFRNKREYLLNRMLSLKEELSSLQKQKDNETVIEVDMKNALIIAELKCLNASKQKLRDEYQLLQQKIHRLEAQRNATRVIEENQQFKLKHNIEMKQDQVKKLKALLKQKPDNTCLEEELSNVRESLEDDTKSYEDLEFQYLEGESEWQVYRDDLNSEEQIMNKQITEHQLSIDNIKKQQLCPFYTVSAKKQRLSSYLLFLMKELHQCEEQFKIWERTLSLQFNTNTSVLEENNENPSSVIVSQAQITESPFGDTEMLCSKTCNENIFYNNEIELPANESTVSKVNLSKKSVNLIMKAEKQRQLIPTQKGLLDLDSERRKIEEILRKLQSDVEQKTVPAIDNNKSPKFYPKQGLLPRSAASSPCNKLSLSLICKSVNELPVSSLDSPTSFNIDDISSSSLLSNELSSEGDCSNLSCDRKNTRNQNQQRPLTRYLPIFAEDLDLKRHIESAGHPISVCSHIFLDIYSCRGYLHKLGSSFHTWSKRWFLLDRQRTALIYYTDKSERKPKGGAYFSSIDEVYMDHLNISKTSRPHSTFIVKTKKRRYYLQAHSDTEARIWIDAIITGAQGNIDY